MKHACENLNGEEERMASGVGLSRDRRIVPVVDMLCLYRHRKKNWEFKKKERTEDDRQKGNKFWHVFCSNL
jgi:hypothetical protein